MTFVIGGPFSVEGTNNATARLYLSPRVMTDPKDSSTPSDVRDGSPSPQAPQVEVDEPLHSEADASSEDKPRRKIRIGSQRDAKVAVKAKPKPPPLELRPSAVEPKVPPAPEEPPAKTTPAEEAPQAEMPGPVTPPEPSPNLPPAEAPASSESEGQEASVESTDQAVPAIPPVPETADELPQTIEQPGELSESLEAEIEAALGGMSVEDLLGPAVQKGDATGGPLDPESRIRATVLKLDRENVFFALGGRDEGFTSLAKFATPPSPGDALEVVVQRFDPEEGLYEVSVPGASVDVGDWSDIDEGMTVEARVTGHNTGGLECELNHIRGFIPASQIALYRVENFEEFVGQKLPCVVTEANPQRQNLVLSHRAVLERQREESRQKMLESLEVGQVHEGVVRKLMDFGAFVELAPGIDGLIHISKLSWDRVNHPSEVLQEGQRVQVTIEKVDLNTGKIGLAYRDLQENPWTNVAVKYPTGTVVQGTVTRLAQFGCFVKLEPGVEGLVHISEMAHHRVQRANSVVSEGEQVEVKVLDVDADAQRIGLSIKAVQQAPETASPSQQADDDEPPRELAVPKRKGPLKGGTEGSSGGEKFGLKW